MSGKNSTLCGKQLTISLRRKQLMSKISDLLTEVQKELLVQGINPGKVDGEMGPLTYKALLAYQKRGERPTTPQVIKKITSHAQPAWRLAKSLEVLRAQINTAYPKRNR